MVWCLSKILRKNGILIGVAHKFYYHFRILLSFQDSSSWIIVTWEPFWRHGYAAFLDVFFYVVSNEIKVTQQSCDRSAMQFSVKKLLYFFFYVEEAKYCYFFDWNFKNHAILTFGLSIIIYNNLNSKLHTDALFHPCLFFKKRNQLLTWRKTLNDY